MGEGGEHPRRAGRRGGATLAVLEGAVCMIQQSILFGLLFAFPASSFSPERRLPRPLAQSTPEAPRPRRRCLHVPCGRPPPRPSPLLLALSRSIWRAPPPSLPLTALRRPLHHLPRSKLCGAGKPKHFSRKTLATKMTPTDSVGGLYTTPATVDWTRSPC